MTNPNEGDRAIYRELVLLTSMIYHPIRICQNVSRKQPATDIEEKGLTAMTR